MHRICTRLALLLALSLPAFSQSVLPFMGLGSAQFIDNNGKPLTAGVLYSFQAGTSNQQATYTDSTGTNQNPNPISFNPGARASIWLSIGKYYKFVLCAQNDGPACAPADTIFSVDNVPAGSTSSGGGASPFTGTFISGSATPATTGVLRLASGDAICFRNAAGSANLCFTKDSSDVVSFGTGALKNPEISCGSTAAGFDYLCADSSAHRWKMANNGGSQVQIVGSGVDINASDQVTQLHFGAAAAPLGGSSPATNQFLQWNGTNIVGGAPEQILGWGVAAANLTIVPCSNTASQVCAVAVFVNQHTGVRLDYILQATPVGCSTAAVVGIYDITAASALYTASIPNGTGTGFFDSGAISINLPAGHTIGVGEITASSGCSTPPLVGGVQMVYQ